MKKFFSIVLAVALLFSVASMGEFKVSAKTDLPDELYISQATNYTCTLASSAMMLRSRAYLSGYCNWKAITEKAVKPVAWTGGLRWSFTYKTTGISISVSHAKVSGISVSSLKALLKKHPEGIVLYCGRFPHAVFVTDYEGNTFYCSDPANDNYKDRGPLASSYLAKKYGSQASILKNTTAYWYVSSYSVTKKASNNTHNYKIASESKATTSKDGKTVKECTVCGKVKNTTFKYAKTFTLSKTSCTYNGKEQKPAVTVKDSAGKAISSKYYTVTYKNNTNVGQATVTVKMKGNYKGTKTLTFDIKPKAASIDTLTADSKKLTVKLNRRLQQSTGYEIQYSTSKTFKNAKTKTVTSYKTSSVTLSGLKARKTYYVRVRTYKTVGKTKYYSNWSSYKYKKTK